MYVRNHMLPKDKLTIVYVDESIGSALEKINEGNFLSLPVFEGDTFRGILMKEAIYRYYFETGCRDKDEFINEVKVSELFTDKYKSIKENELIENASYLLNEFRTPFLPVFDTEDRFAGILTHTAIFNAFSDLLGIGKGTRIMVNLFDIPGQMAKLVDVISKEGINIVNFAIMDAKVLDVYNVVIRVGEMENTDALVEKIKKAGFKVVGVAK